MGISTEFISYISAPAISPSFDLCDLVKGRLMCIVLCPNIVLITMTLFCIIAISCHPCVIMHEVVDELLDKICHYIIQQNVRQN